MRVRKTGPWSNYPAKLRRASVDVQQEVLDVTRGFVQEVREYLVDGVASDRFRLAPITEATRDRRLGNQDAPPLIDTHDYMDAIQVQGIPGGFRLGLEKDPTGRDLDKISKRLEFGSSSMPPRPHWRPTQVWATQNMPRLARMYGLKVGKALR